MLASNATRSARRARLSHPGSASSHKTQFISPFGRFFNTNDANAQDAIVHIPRADVFRFGDGNKARPVFKDLEWTVKEGESWAIVGPAGSGKSDLLEVRHPSISLERTEVNCY